MIKMIEYLELNIEICSAKLTACEKSTNNTRKFQYDLILAEMRVLINRLKKLKQSVVKVEQDKASAFCSYCGGEFLHIERSKCATEGCVNCIF